MLIYKIIGWIADFVKEKRDYLSLPFICLMVAMPMFFRGLYFEEDRALFGILAAIILFVIFACEKKHFNINTGIDMGVIILTAIYGFTTLFAVNKDSAILAFSSYILLLLIYLAVKSIADQEDRIRVLITVSCWAIAVMSLISLLTAAKIINYPVAYSDAEAEKWLNGTVQYHNAFGAMVLAGFFGLCGVYEKSMKRVMYWINLLGVYLLMFGIIMSYSRGAWLMAPLAFIVYMIMANKDARLKVVSYLITTAISVFAVLAPFTAAVEAEQKLMGAVWLLAGLVITIILSVMLDIVINQIKDYKHFNISVISVSVVLVVIVAIIVLFPQMFSFMLPDSLITRLQGLNFGTVTVTERFVFYSDAFNMSKRNLLFGSGGGAWADMYGMYQQYNYSSSQIHSYLFQILTDTGIIGVIAFAWILVFLVISAIKMKKIKNISGGTKAALFSVCGALIFHSLIDFDLSIFGVIVILWAFLAMISKLSGRNDIKVSKYIWASVCVVMLVFSSTNFAGTRAEARGNEIFNKYLNDENEGHEVSYESYLPALEEYEKAASLKPYDAVALSAKAKARMYAQPTVKESRELAVAEFEKAEKLAPYSFEVQKNGVDMYSRINTTLKYAVTCLKKQVELFPKHVDYYLAYIQSAYDVMNYYRYDGILNTAGEISKEALAVKALAEEHKTVLPDTTKGYFDMFEVVYNNTLRGTDKE